MITLSSDLGNNNTEVALYRATFIQSFPEDTIIDIIHLDDSYDIESMGYSLYEALYSFPPNSIHIALNKYSRGLDKLIIVKLLDQYVIASDNGLVSLLHNIDYQSTVYSYPFEPSSLFNLKDYVHFLAETILALRKNKLNLSPYPMFTQMMPFNTELMILENTIISRVIYINSMGNIVVNLTKDGFDQYVKGKRFNIKIVQANIKKISTNYADVDADSLLGAVFNMSGYLELFLSGGNLAKLYGINKLSNNKIEIEIEHETSGQINF